MGLLLLLLLVLLLLVLLLLLPLLFLLLLFWTLSGPEPLEQHIRIVGAVVAAAVVVVVVVVVVVAVACLPCFSRRARHVLSTTRPSSESAGVQPDRPRAIEPSKRSRASASGGA